MTKKFIKLGHPTLVQRTWRSRFKNSNVPSPSTILGVVSKLEKTGFLKDKPPLQNKIADRFEDVKNQLKKLYQEDPTLSLSKASPYVDISYNATRDIV